MRAAGAAKPDVIDLVCEIQREFSRQSDPGELARTFVRELAGSLPISRLLYVMPWPPPVRRFACAPNPDVQDGSLGYRVLLDADVGAPLDLERFRAMFRPRIDDDADARGGLLGEIVSQARPILRGDLAAPTDDESEGNDRFRGRHHRSMMAVPIYWLGSIQGWIVAFSDTPEAFSRDDLRLLLTTGNTLVRSTVYLDALDDARRANAKVAETLARIGRVQRSMLVAPPPADERLEVALAYETCEDSGGDFYDLYQPVPGTLDIVIADVSGHGPVASVGVAMLRTALLGARRRGLTGPDAARDIDALMGDTLRPDTFITAIFVRLDLATGCVAIANYGHPSPIIRRAGKHAESVVCGGNPPLGLSYCLGSASADPPATLRLGAGDLLVLYTDGVTEAASPAGDLFGVERLLGTIDDAGGSPNQTRDRIVRAVTHHERGRPRRDDQSLVAVRLSPPASSGEAKRPV